MPSSMRRWKFTGKWAPALWIGREFALGRTIWYFRVADIADMAILGPILMGVLLYLWMGDHF